MSWRLVWSTEAVSDLSRLDNKMASRIVEKLEAATKDPIHYTERLAGSDYHKVRIGDYRVIVMFFHSNQTIFIQKLGHRKNVYKELG